MVFVSYSHDDKEWLERFRKVFKPLNRYAEIDLWSDKRIKAGADWRAEITKAMANAVVAVLLVSLNFLDSDFIGDEELPYILDAARKQKIQILWILLTPCLYKVTPLEKIKAAAGFPDPLNQMTEYEWMEAFCTVCDEIDKIVKKIETPVINSKLNGRALQPCGARTSGTCKTGQSRYRSFGLFWRGMVYPEKNSEGINENRVLYWRQGAYEIRRLFSNRRINPRPQSTPQSRK